MFGRHHLAPRDLIVHLRPRVSRAQPWSRFATQCCWIWASGLTAPDRLGRAQRSTTAASWHRLSAAYTLAGGVPG
jgi:hypothetical protein